MVLITVFNTPSPTNLSRIYYNNILIGLPCSDLLGGRLEENKDKVPVQENSISLFTLLIGGSFFFFFLPNPPEHCFLYKGILHLEAM